MYFIYIIITMQLGSFILFIMFTNQVEIGAPIPVCWKFPKNFNDLLMQIYWA